MPNVITCEVSGQTWPAEKRADLRPCVRCGGLIDTRHEAWWEQKGVGATHWPDHCPTAPSAE